MTGEEKTGEIDKDSEQKNTEVLNEYSTAEKIVSGLLNEIKSDYSDTFEDSTEKKDTSEDKNIEKNDFEDVAEYNGDIGDEQQESEEKSSKFESEPQKSANISENNCENSLFSSEMQADLSNDAVTTTLTENIKEEAVIDENEEGFEVLSSEEHKEEQGRESSEYETKQDMLVLTDNKDEINVVNKLDDDSKASTNENSERDDTKEYEKSNENEGDVCLSPLKPAGEMESALIERSSLEQSTAGGDLPNTNDTIEGFTVKDGKTSQEFAEIQSNEFIQSQNQFESDTNSATQFTLASSSRKLSLGRREQSEHNMYEQELEGILDMVINKFVAPPTSLRVPIKQYINRKRVRAVLKGDYVEAELMDRANKALVLSLQQEKLKAHQDNSLDILYSRYQKLQADKQNMEEYWNNRIATFIEQDNQRLEELKRKHEEELEEFNAKWRDPLFLRQFNKPSTQLLQLREMEKARAVSRLYDKAREMKAIADKLQKEETVAAQRKINQQMVMDRDKLAQKHEKELIRHKEHQDKNILTLNKEKENNLKHIINAIQQLKAKRGLIVQNRPSTASIKKIYALADGSPFSPRTQKQYTNYRAEKKRTRLDVKPADENALKTARKNNLTIKRQVRVIRNTAKAKASSGLNKK